ncbi:hypothetical protein BLA28_11810 [Eisenbergiella tayi]|nr:hypothetical protein BLA28_11810 [Eisenbergiella tayi]
MQAKKNNPPVIGVKCREGRNVTVQPLPFCQVCISGPGFPSLCSLGFLSAGIPRSLLCAAVLQGSCQGTLSFG